MKWLDKIPLTALLPIAVILAVAPVSPEPHLWQKANMLIQGNLVKPLDIFDLLFHAAPLILLLLKLLRSRQTST